MPRLYLDVETRWAIDLDSHGAYRCASDPTAGLNCLCYALDDGPLMMVPYVGYKGELWHDVERETAWEYYQPYPQGMLAYEANAMYESTMNNVGMQPSKTPTHWKKLFDFSTMDRLVGLLAREDVTLVAHNALFEVICLLCILGIEIDLTRVICTMAKCAYYGYPRGLDDAAKALGCSSLKDLHGKAVMKKLVKATLTPDDDPFEFAALYRYCAADVLPLREIDQKLPDLPQDVQDLCVLDAEINLRGVPIDLQAIQNAIALKEQIAKDNNRLMAELTLYHATSVNQTEKIQNFLKQHYSVDMEDMKADTVAKFLQRDDIHPHAKEILALRQEAGLSSLAKFQKMLDYQVDGRLYGMWNFYGAHTGRPTGEGPQVLNLARSQNPEFWAEILRHNPEWFSHVDAPAEHLKEALRGVIYSGV